MQHFRSFGSEPTDGENLPILDPALWSFWLPFLIAVLVAAIGLEIAKYRIGRWTWPLVAVNAVLDLAFAVPLVWLVSPTGCSTPSFVARFEWLGEGDNLEPRGDRRDRRHGAGDALGHPRQRRKTRAQPHLSHHRHGPARHACRAVTVPPATGRAAPAGCRIGGARRDEILTWMNSDTDEDWRRPGPPRSSAGWTSTSGWRRPCWRCSA